MQDIRTVALSHWRGKIEAIRGSTVVHRREPEIIEIVLLPKLP